jgi:exosortase C (VPDSG-CTERM-specific)
MGPSGALSECVELAAREAPAIARVSNRSLLDERDKDSLKPVSPGRRKFVLIGFLILWVVCFSHPLYDLAHFALSSNLYSHILLIPFLSGYLIWLKRRDLHSSSQPLRKSAMFLFATGAGLPAVCFVSPASGAQAHIETYLALVTFASLSFLWGGCLFFFGAASRVILFPLLFLLFVIPLPDIVLHQIQSFLQTASAAAAHFLFLFTGMPVLQQGARFQLPGFYLEVARECSGIHSSLVLLITSFLAGHLLLRKLWTKTLLVFFVLPLAILRNAIRVFVIGQLCVRVSPDMLHSWIHTRGGPLFFVGSLLPFFALLGLLMKIEIRRSDDSVSQAA